MLTRLYIAPPQCQTQNFKLQSELNGGFLKFLPTKKNDSFIKYVILSILYLFIAFISYSFFFQQEDERIVPPVWEEGSELELQVVVQEVQPPCCLCEGDVGGELA